MSYSAVASARPASPQAADAVRPKSLEPAVHDAGATSRRPQKARVSSPGGSRAATPRSIWPLVVATITGMVLAAGWAYRDEGHLTPETGTGYWLGIIGGTMMLLLLIYPLRKRWSRLGVIGSIPGWFRLHMLLGVAGPTLVMLHSNFALGALNSNVALFSMLAVVASGIVGRYLYIRVHHGLSGRRISIAELVADMHETGHCLGDEVASNRLKAVLASLEQQVVKPRRGLVDGIIARIRVGSNLSRTRREAGAIIRAAIATQATREGFGWNERRRRRSVAMHAIDRIVADARKAAALAVFERLFALWHVFHTPLFILLILSAIVHVIAVHLY